MKTAYQLLALGSFTVLGMSGFLFYRGQAQQAAVLKKIIALEMCLAINNHLVAQEMAQTVRGIRIVVFKNRNQARDMLVLQQSQQILSRSESITDTLRCLKQELRQSVGERPIGPLLQPDTPAPTLGQARQLAYHINRFAAFIQQYDPSAPLLTQPRTGLSGSTWLYTDHAAIAAALSSLTRLEADVRNHAAEALSGQAQKVGSSCSFDKIVAMAIATSNTVAPGKVYEAQLFVSMAASSYNPNMTANGKQLDVQPDGAGLVEFKVPSSRPNQPDTMRGWWQGTIKARTYRSDTTWHLSVPYFIVRQPAL